KGEPESEWTAGGVTQGYPSPLYHEGRVSGLTQVAATCFDAVTGEELWRRLKGPFAASPVLGDGKLYAVSEYGVCSVLDLSVVTSWGFRGGGELALNALESL